MSKHNAQGGAATVNVWWTPSSPGSADKGHEIYAI